MKLQLFVLVILFVSVYLLLVPDLTHYTVLGQADRSFKGTTAPFVPPSTSERLGTLPGNNFEFDDNEIDGGGEAEEEGEEEIDRDEFPVLTKQERDEFLADNTDIIEPERLTILSQEETTTDNDDIDPISSIVEEIVKNETIIGDEEFVPSPESSIIKFKDQELEQILDVQEVAPEPDNQTISTTEEEQEDDLPLNVTEDDFEIEQSDQISESESPDVNVQSLINKTADGEAVTAPTDNETATTTTEDAVEDETIEEAITAPTDNETATTTTTTTEDAVEEDQTPPLEEEEQEQQTEEDEAQTPPLEEEEQEQQTEESPNTAPIAQDSSGTTSQNQQLDIQLNANDADGDKLSFTIVDEPSNGQLENMNPSTNTVTYIPEEDYSGVDNFTFTVNDGTIDSNKATIAITVEQQQTEQAQQEEQEEEDEVQTPLEEEEEEEEEEAEPTLEEEEEEET
jgi:Bacterial Ig domain